MVVVCALILISGCGSEEFNANQVAVEQQEKVENYSSEILGAWHNTDIEIEFHGSHFNQVSAHPLIQQSSLKTGRLVDNGRQRKFHWRMGNDGLLYVNIVSNSCVTVPLDTCSVIEIKQISLHGTDVAHANWKIETDQDLDGVYETTVEQSLVKSTLTGRFGEGKQFLKLSGNFDRPIIVASHDGKLDVVLPVSSESTHQYFALSTTLDEESSALKLNADNELQYIQVQDFSVAGQADLSVDIKHTVTNVAMRSGVEESVIIDYEITRELSLPDGITESDLDLSSFKDHERHTMVFRDVVTLKDDIHINLDETYYSKIPGNFNFTADSAGNEITFFGNMMGKIAFTTPSDDTAIQEQSFSWSYKNSQEVEFKLEDGRSWSLGFVDASLGGHNAIFYNEENEVIGHDFLREGYIESSQLIPGRFKLENTDGLSTVDVEFKGNGEILIQSGPVTLNGFWELTNTGEIISFECERYNGSIITSLSVCQELMNSAGEEGSPLKFGHIRKFKFLAQSGSDLVSTYNAIAWGEPITTSTSPIHFNWVYRWQRVGD